MPQLLLHIDNSTFVESSVEITVKPSENITIECIIDMTNALQIAVKWFLPNDGISQVVCIFYYQITIHFYELVNQINLYIYRL